MATVAMHNAAQALATIRTYQASCRFGRPSHHDSAGRHAQFTAQMTRFLLLCTQRVGRRAHAPTEDKDNASCEAQDAAYRRQECRCQHDDRRDLHPDRHVPMLQRLLGMVGDISPAMEIQPLPTTAIIAAAPKLGCVHGQRGAQRLSNVHA